MASTSDSKLVIFLGGIALGGSIAIGSAYLLSRRFKDLEERFAAREAEDQERQPTSARDRTRRCVVQPLMLCARVTRASDALNA
jgi:hypothetical protein